MGGILRKVVCVFGGANYDRTTAAIVERAPNLGADEVLVFDDKWLLDHPHAKVNKWFFDKNPSRAISWYTWKPLVVRETMNLLSHGDICFYMDADVVPIRDFSVLFDIANRDSFMLFEASQFKNANWCKSDAYLVTGCDEKKYHDAQAAVARYMLFKKGVYATDQFLAEWLTYTCNKFANTFDKSVLSVEPEELNEHRCEQAILNLLAVKYGCKLWREPDESGDMFSHDKDVYPTLFQQVPTSSFLNKTAPILGSSYRNVPHPSKWWIDR